jgi:hypothetical protein
VDHNDLQGMQYATRTIIEALITNDVNQADGMTAMLFLLTGIIAELATDAKDGAEGMALMIGSAQKLYALHISNRAQSN